MILKYLKLRSIILHMLVMEIAFFADKLRYTKYIKKFCPQEHVPNIE